MKDHQDIVERRADVHDAARPPLLILETVRSFLDEHGLGSGALHAHRIGEGGGSNFSFLLERDDGLYVLRRPPRPPLPPSAHDVVRESGLQLALAPLGIRVPNIRAVCEDDSLLGVPFYVMDYIAGDVITTALPPPLDRD
ncbi:MAG: phosphotransferase, partial [Actinomycetota bacterium]|nr:phosphotransferase [Actinomycetota bacterium]